MRDAGLTRLNDAERRVLGLLAEGHTAKSVAAVTGWSEGAVNERLREARRKTGLSSSRELARLLKVQENRDEQIEIATAPDAIRYRRVDHAFKRAERTSRRTIAVIAGLALIGGLVASFAMYDEHEATAPAGPPRVVSTLPLDGARIAPGRFVLSVTFDRPMTSQSYSFTTPDGPAAYPDCDGAPRQSPDLRTFSLTCIAKPGHDYAIGFNTPPFRNFTSADEQMPAGSAMLRFSAR